MRRRILTGDRPTGKLHLGHYVGSIENRPLPTLTVCGSSSPAFGKIRRSQESCPYSALNTLAIVRPLLPKIVQRFQTLD